MSADMNYPGSCSDHWTTSVLGNRDFFKVLVGTVPATWDCTEHSGERFFFFSNIHPGPRQTWDQSQIPLSMALLVLVMTFWLM